MTRLGLALVLLASCGGASTTPRPPDPVSGRSVDAAVTLETRSEDVTFTVGGRTIPGTLVAPAANGPWPAVLILAGSGPTDRDWNSALIATKNGSGKLLAEAIARHGTVVLRFDKVGSGKNPALPPDRWTLDTYRDEAAAALAWLRARPDVRADRVFVAGHSEGGLHATRLAQAHADQLAGVLYLSSAARSMAETLLTQLSHQLRNPLSGLNEAQVDRELASIRAALEDFRAGKPVDPKTSSSIMPVQQLIAHVTMPASAPLVRALLFFDTAAEASTLALPMLVVGGGKDIQVDPTLDVAHFDRTVRARNPNVELVVAPDADHVLKREPKTVAELRANLAAVQDGYNADDRTLDDAVVDAIVRWLAKRTR